MSAHALVGSGRWRGTYTRDVGSPLLRESEPTAVSRHRWERRLPNGGPLLGFGAAFALLAAGVVAVGIGSTRGPDSSGSGTTTAPAPTSEIHGAPTAAATAVATAPSPVAPEACPSMPQMGLLSSTRGWALTDKGLFATTDGGTRWHDISPPAPISTGMVVEFIDADRGWVVDDHGTASSVYRTVDGGRSWKTVPVPTPGGTDVILEFLDAAHGWAWVSRENDTPRLEWSLSRTVDGGDSWELLASPSPVSPGAVFVTAQQGWGATAADQPATRLLRTFDAGRTWSDHAQQPLVTEPGSGVSGIAPTWFDGRNGIATAHARVHRTYFVTGDGGLTWAPRDLPDGVTPIPTGPPVTFVALDSRRWRLAWLDDVYASEDAGRSWRVVGGLGIDGYVQRLSFATAAVGWAVVEAVAPSSSCRGWHVLATKNGGATWGALPLATISR